MFPTAKTMQWGSSHSSRLYWLSPSPFFSFSFSFLSLSVPCFLSDFHLAFLYSYFPQNPPQSITQNQSTWAHYFSPRTSNTAMFSVVSLCFHLFLGCSFRFSSSSHKINSTASLSSLCSVIKNNVLLDRGKNRHTHTYTLIQSQVKP